MENNFKLLAKLEKKKKILESELAKLKDEIRDTKEIVKGELQHLGLNNTKLDSGETIYLNGSTRAHTTNTELFHRYLIDTGQGDMIKHAVPHQTLCAWAKQALEEGSTEEHLNGLGLKVSKQYDVRVKGVKV